MVGTKGQNDQGECEEQAVIPGHPFAVRDQGHQQHEVADMGCVERSSARNMSQHTTNSGTHLQLPPGVEPMQRCGDGGSDGDGDSSTTRATKGEGRGETKGATHTPAAPPRGHCYIVVHQWRPSAPAGTSLYPLIVTGDTFVMIGFMRFPAIFSSSRGSSPLLTARCSRWLPAPGWRSHHKQGHRSAQHARFAAVRGSGDAPRAFLGHFLLVLAERATGGAGLPMPHAGGRGPRWCYA